MQVARYEVVATRQLANGLTLHLTYSKVAPPGAADVVVVTMDNDGGFGTLAKYVIAALDLNQQEFENVLGNRPVTRFGDNVLVVQTVFDRPQDVEGVRNSFDRALARLDEFERRGTIWLPLLGSGGGGLSLTQSEDLLLDALTRWSQPGPTHTVLLACETAAIAHELAGRWPQPAARAESKPLAPRELEPHVARILRVAEQVARDQLVRPRHVVTAIRADVGATSTAFDRLRTLVEFLPAPAAIDGSALAGDPLDALEAELAHAIARGRERRSRDDEVTLWGRDLVTAILLCRDSELARQLEAHGSSITELRDLWYRFVTGEGRGRSISAWNEWWHDAGVLLPPQRLQSGHATEAVEGQEDRLGSGRQAEAFARLVLDHGVEPPLSIALLGDWGSGKSFFMKEIRAKMAGMQGQDGFYEHVLPIQFNAWHFSDSNLWAGLVTHIFDAIWIHLTKDKDPEQEKARQKKLLDELRKARGAVHEVTAQLKAQLETAKENLTQAETTRDGVKPPEAFAALLRKVAAAEGLPIRDFELAITELASTSGQLRQTFAAWASRPARLAIWLVLGLLGAVVGPELVAAMGLEARWFFDPIITALATAGGVLAPFLNAQKRVERFRAELTKYEDSPKRREWQREVACLEAKVEAARDTVVALETQVGMNQPSHRFETFIQDRVQSDQYRSRQGIIALVRRDFEKLSTLLGDERKSRRGVGDVGVGDLVDEAVDSPNTPTNRLRPLDRIVLFIDDLDRCRPEHVVHALEAVNLLLAFDLFVVVVAVDSRWLVRALEVHYGEMLDGADKPDQARDDISLRRSTPQNYLEKIFQITYALGTMDPKLARDYVEYLTVPRPSASKPRKPDPLRAKSDSEPAPAKPEPKPVPAESEPKPEPAKPDSKPAPAKSAPSDPLRVVRISEAEIEFLVRLIPVLPTPRSVKRLVNVYRLLKSSCTAEDTEAYERDRHRQTLLMLAVLFGMPAIAPDLFRALHHRQAPFDEPDRPLVTAVERHLETLADHEARQWARLRDEIQRVDPELLVRHCTPEAYVLARYSLATGHEWHTWVRPEPA